jgi:hypothetical protein
VICRLWRGWTAAENADAYERYLREELYPRLDREVGNDRYRGYQLLRREQGEEVEFVTMTWFDSLESVQAFAGPEFETPVITAKAADLLSRYDDRALHYGLAATSIGANGEAGS